MLYPLRTSSLSIEFGCWETKVWSMGISHFGCGEYPVGYWEDLLWLWGKPTLVMGKTHFGCWDMAKYGIWVWGQTTLAVGRTQFGLGENFLGVGTKNPPGEGCYLSPLTV